MAARREFLVDIRGDTSHLERAIADAHASMEKISDYTAKVSVDFDNKNANIKPLLQFLDKQELKAKVNLEVGQLINKRGQLDAKGLVDEFVNEKSFKKKRESAVKNLNEMMAEIKIYEDILAGRKITGSESDIELYGEGLVEKFKNKKYSRSAHNRAVARAAYYGSAIGEEYGNDKQIAPLLRNVSVMVEPYEKVLKNFNFKDFMQSSTDEIKSSIRESENIYRQLHDALKNPVEFKTSDSEIDKEIDKTKELKEARKEAADASNNEPEYKSQADEIQKETDAINENTEAKKAAENVDSSGSIKKEADIAKELIAAQEKLNSLVKERKKISRKSIDDDALYHATKYNGEEVEALGTYSGRELKEKMIKRGYQYVGHSGWQRKGGLTTYQLDRADDGIDPVSKLENEIAETESLIFSLKQAKKELNKPSKPDPTVEKEKENLEELAKAKEDAAKPVKSESAGSDVGPTEEQLKRQTEALNRLKKAKEDAAEPVKSEPNEPTDEQLRRQAEELERLQAKNKAARAKDSGAEASAAGASQESEKLNDVEKSATGAAEAKQKFADANADLLSSILSSLSGLDNEGNAFKNLNKLLNNIGSEKGTEKFEKLKTSLEELYGLLNKGISPDSLIKSLEKLSATGDSLKDLATVIRASKKQMNDAQKAVGGGDKAASSGDISKRRASLDELNERMEKSSVASDELKAKVKGLYETLEGGNITSSALKDFDKQIKAVTSDLDKAEQSAVKQYQKQLAGYEKRLNNFDSKRYPKTAEIVIGKDESGNIKTERIEIENEVERIKKLITDLKDDSGNIRLDIDIDELIAKTKEIIESMELVDKVLDDPFANSKSIANLDKQMADFVANNKRLTKEYIDDIQRLRAALKGATKSQFESTFEEFRGIQARAADQNLLGGTSTLENLGNRIKQMNTNFIGMFFSFYDIIRYAKEIAGAVTEVDTALTELRKVSDASNERIQQSFEQSAATAKELGATVTDVINSTSDWARLGYSVDQAEDLARVTQLYQNVGDNMTQEDASESLISTLKGFQYDASEAESIVDRFNEVANNYAIDTKGIGDALQRSASAFNASHTDLDKSIALITATNTVIKLCLVA